LEGSGLGLIHLRGWMRKTVVRNLSVSKRPDWVMPYGTHRHTDTLRGQNAEFLSEEQLAPNFRAQWFLHVPIALQSLKGWL
jgi:hypothetical protein